MQNVQHNKLKDAIANLPGYHYQCEGASEKFRGIPVSQLPSALRFDGWRNVPRFRDNDIEKLGFKIVSARYVGGARPKRFCQVVVIKESKNANNKGR